MKNSDYSAALAKRLLADMECRDKEAQDRTQGTGLTVVYIPGNLRDFAHWRRNHPEFRLARVIYADGPEKVLGLERIDRIVSGVVVDDPRKIDRRNRMHELLKTRNLGPEARWYYARPDKSEGGAE